MTTPWTITVDCTDAVAQATFWRAALGYVDAPPPTGWTDWTSWFDDFDVPEAERRGVAAIVDPEGRLPRISFLGVPEDKRAKNRLHIDLQVSGGRHLDGELRTAAIEQAVETLVGLGATVVARYDDGDRLDHVVLQDPEGNELCVV